MVYHLSLGTSCAPASAGALTSSASANVTRHHLRGARRAAFTSALLLRKAAEIVLQSVDYSLCVSKLVLGGAQSGFLVRHDDEGTFNEDRGNPCSTDDREILALHTFVRKGQLHYGRSVDRISKCF